MRYHIILYMLCGSLIGPSLCRADGSGAKDFTLSYGTEAGYAIAGLASHLAANHILDRMSVPDPVTLDKGDVNALDRFAIENYSKKESYYSDNTTDATVALLMLSLIPHVRDADRESIRALFTDIVMYLEAETLIVGITQCAKGLAERPRPFAYNPDIPYGSRSRQGAFESFWSGHTSNAFATAVFTGYVFQSRHPDSRFVRPVWIAGIGCATATAVLRVSSGNHFPTDVIAGAAAGSLVGWLVPWMHRDRNMSLSVNRIADGGSEVGIVYVF